MLLRSAWLGLGLELGPGSGLRVGVGSVRGCSDLHRGAPLLRGPERGLALRQLVLRAARLLGERAHLRLG